MPSNPPSRPTLWADITLSVWVIIVGVVYYGGFFTPRLAALTGIGAAIYGLLLLTGAVSLALRFLRRGR